MMDLVIENSKLRQFIRLILSVPQSISTQFDSFS